LTFNSRSGEKLQYVTLGTTGISVSRLAFGAGPVADVMVGADTTKQHQLMRRVIDAGINWIDTAAGYGDGRAEEAIGSALSALSAHEQMHVATKVRIARNQLDDIPAAIRESATASLRRLKRNQFTLLQLHNSITERCDDEPYSLTADQVLGPNGVLEVFEQLRDDGIIRMIGITAIGHARPLNEVVDSGRFQTIQVPYNLVNPSAGQEMSTRFEETNYGNVIQRAADRGMGIFAIRVYAGGALVGNPPSRHTLTTKFFPLDLFERDRRRAAALREITSNAIDLKQLALRFSLSHPDVASAIVGFGEPKHVDEAVDFLNAGPIPKTLLAKFQSIELQ
jgi:L-galactose dehydrogenase/L-glyceraldehyde 3-phosphate reductase